MTLWCTQIQLYKPIECPTQEWSLKWAANLHQTSMTRHWWESAVLGSCTWQRQECMGEKPLCTVYLLFKNKHKPFEKSGLLEKQTRTKCWSNSSLWVWGSLVCWSQSSWQGSRESKGPRLRAWNNWGEKQAQVRLDRHSQTEVEEFHKIEFRGAIVSIWEQWLTGLS